jgi:hypothetical protein
MMAFLIMHCVLASHVLPEQSPGDAPVSRSGTEATSIG